MKRDEGIKITSIAAAFVRSRVTNNYESERLVRQYWLAHNTNKMMFLYYGDNFGGIFSL